MRQRTALASLAIAWAAVSSPAFARPVAPPERPRLVVMISIDALSADVFSQWRGLASDGVARLGSAGIYYPNAFQAHGVTETCPGHATMATGRHPRAHGITANSWYDVDLGRAVGCARPPSNGAADARPNAEALRVPALGDWMKAADAASRVYAIAGKDYAATMMGGRSPDGVFWYEIPGRFARSTNADQALLDQINRVVLPPAVASKTPSDHCRAGASDVAVPDTAPFEYADLDRQTLRAASILIELERLGQGEAPDLLAISLSATDVVGHLHGSSSWRMCEQGRALDAALGAFIRSVEATGVPFLISLAADHGQSDTIESLATQGYPAWRSTTTVADLNVEMRRRFSLRHDPIVTGDGPRSPLGDSIQLYVVGSDGHGATTAMRSQIASAAVEWLSQRREVEAAFAASELMVAPTTQAAVPDEISLLDRMRLSFVSGRSGDILVAYAPYTASFPMSPGMLVASHGSPYNYDRRIPIAFIGSGIEPEVRNLPIAAVDVAPTIAAMIEISPLNGVDGTARPLVKRGQVGN